MKRCRKCNEEKPASEFYKNRTSSDGLQSYCKPCHATAQLATVAKNPEKYRAKQQEWKLGKGRKKHLISHARKRAKDRGLPFSITADDIEIPEFCPVLGIPIIQPMTGKVAPGCATIDRIVPELGYVPGNVQVMSHLANAMKNNATPEQLLAFADWVYKTYGEA